MATWTFGKKCRLMIMLWMTASFFFVEIVVGYVCNSMALVADSFHMLSDVAALVVAYISVRMSPKKWSKNTFGWARAEVLGALVNAVFLVAICFSITVEACKRFVEVEPINDPELLLIVGGVGLLINVVGLFLFHEHGHVHSHDVVPIQEQQEDGYPVPLNIPVKHSHNASQMNMRGVFLHVLSDALGSVIVVGSALIVWLTDWEYKFYIDPALSIILVILIVHSVWPLMRESALILLQTVPTHIQVDSIQRRLLESVDGVLAVHEFHVWQLAGDKIIASAHIRIRNLLEYMSVAERVKEFFHNEGIHSTTIQPEFVELTGLHMDTVDCALDCPITDTPCAQATCCNVTKVDRETSASTSLQFMIRKRSPPDVQDSDSGTSPPTE